VGYILLIRPRVDAEEWEKYQSRVSRGDSTPPQKMQRTPVQKALVVLAIAAIAIEIIVLAYLVGVDNVYDSCE
jgi:hypothetical protein